MDGHLRFEMSFAADASRCQRDLHGFPWRVNTIQSEPVAGDIHYRLCRRPGDASEDQGNATLVREGKCIMSNRMQKAAG